MSECLVRLPQEKDKIEKTMAPRVVSSGGKFTWTGVADWMWARSMSVLDGCVLLGCIPLDYFNKQLQEMGWGLEQCASALLDMDPNKFVEEGGHIQILGKGQGAVIPPAWLIVQVGEDWLPDQRKSKKAGPDGAAILAARLICFRTSQYGSRRYFVTHGFPMLILSCIWFWNPPPTTTSAKLNCFSLAATVEKKIISVFSYGRGGGVNNLLFLASCHLTQTT